MYTLRRFLSLIQVWPQEAISVSLIAPQHCLGLPYNVPLSYKFLQFQTELWLSNKAFRFSDSAVAPLPKQVYGGRHRALFLCLLDDWGKYVRSCPWTYHYSDQQEVVFELKFRSSVYVFACSVGFWWGRTMVHKHDRRAVRIAARKLPFADATQLICNRTRQWFYRLYDVIQSVDGSVARQRNWLAAITSASWNRGNCEWMKKQVSSLWFLAQLTDALLITPVTLVRHIRGVYIRGEPIHCSLCDTSSNLHFYWSDSTRRFMNRGIVPTADEHGVVSVFSQIYIRSLLPSLLIDPIFVHISGLRKGAKSRVCRDRHTHPPSQPAPHARTHKHIPPG